MTRILSLIAALLMMLMAMPAQAQAFRPEAVVLAHVDVETTGLDPSHHEMIDIGMIYTDASGVEIARLYVRIMPRHPERLSPGAQAVNGFDVDYWRAHDAVDETEGVRRIVAFHRETAGDRTVVFTAYNVAFDHAFVGALLERHGIDWRELFFYQNLDIPSMAWSLGLTQMRGAGVAEGLGIPPETSVPLDHTGITGAEFNVAVYRALVAHRSALSR